MLNIKNPNYTWKEVKEAFYYDKYTGILTWKYSHHGVGKGREAGCVKPNGYRDINFKHISVHASRLIWFWYYGEWPKYNIDHINGIRTDNRITNLRDATCRENSSNMQCHRKGKLVGTCWHKRLKKWGSNITVNGVLKHLGYFDDIEEASGAYQKALGEINE